VDSVQVKLSGLELRRPRMFGHCWLAELELRRFPKLKRFFDIAFSCEHIHERKHVRRSLRCTCRRVRPRYEGGVTEEQCIRPLVD
jgi:hypothetical protein